jgi:hypothetical protein
LGDLARQLHPGRARILGTLDLGGLSPEPSQVNLDNIDLKFFYSLDIPKCFIFCRQDKAMPPRYFHPGMSSRLATCKLLEMDGSHEVMFTRPAALAEKLVEASTN